MLFPEDFINKIICGDCIKLMKELPNESVDLIVTSPPYNLRSTNKNPGGGKWNQKLLSDGYAGSNDSMPHNEYVKWQRESLSEMVRVIKDDGAIFYNHKWRIQKGLLENRNDIVEGFPVRQIIIWQRSGGMNFNDGYFLPTYEVIYLICGPKFRLLPKANAIGDVWKIKQEHNNSHPAPFPIEIPLRCIESTNAQIILDPFVGSGTSALAAKNLGRNYIGFDISEEYCEQARKRIGS